MISCRCSLATLGGVFSCPSSVLRGLRVVHPVLLSMCLRARLHRMDFIAGSVDLHKGSTSLHTGACCHMRRRMLQCLQLAQGKQLWR